MLLRSEEIRQGALSSYRMLYVPGGWASTEAHRPGGAGTGRDTAFRRGGRELSGNLRGRGDGHGRRYRSYAHREEAHGRKGSQLSGPVRLRLTGHTIWQGIDVPVFSAWWPSQLRAAGQKASVLASYEEVLPDAFSSDISVAAGRVIGWPALEARYGILLDPARLHREPAVLEGQFGRGKVLLSLIHFDTPGDRNGAFVLKNLWDYLAPGWPSESPVKKARSQKRPLPKLSRIS